MHTGAGQTDQGGGVAGDQRTQPLLELGLLGVDGGDASGELTQHIAGVAHHGVRVVAVVEAAGPVKLLGGGQAAKRLADLARSGQQQRTELVQRPGAVLVRRLVQHLQDTHSLHHPVAGLGDARRRACQRRSGSRFGVDRVGLAAQPACLAVGPVDLDDLDALPAQVPGQPGAVGAGALDTDLVDLAVAAHPPEQFGVAGGGVVERRGPGDVPGRGVDHHRHVRVGMGVHPARDATDGFCHAGRVASSALIQSGSTEPAGRRTRLPRAW